MVRTWFAAWSQPGDASDGDHKLGPVAFGTERQYGGEGYSEAVAAKIDDEISRIIEEGKRRAKETITAHRGALDAIAKELREVETIEREAFEKILIAQGITPKKKEEDLPAIVIAPTDAGI